MRLTWPNLVALHSTTTTPAPHSFIRERAAMGQAQGERVGGNGWAHLRTLRSAKAKELSPAPELLESTTITLMPGISCCDEVRGHCYIIVKCARSGCISCNLWMPLPRLSDIDRRLQQDLLRRSGCKVHDITVAMMSCLQQALPGQRANQGLRGRQTKSKSSIDRRRTPTSRASCTNYSLKEPIYIASINNAGTLLNVSFSCSCEDVVPA